MYLVLSALTSSPISLVAATKASADVQTFIALWDLQRLQNDYIYIIYTFYSVGTAVAHCLICCATNRKVAGSIPAGVTGIFH